MSAPVAGTARRRWLVGPAADLALVALPFVLGAGLALVPQEDPPPLWAFLLLIVAFDVAHVWATLYLSYLDRPAFERRRLLFLLPIPLAIAATYRLHGLDPSLFWSLLAYVAIHHFAAQQWGFVALYARKAGERDPFDRRLDKWTLWTGALGPVLLWHASGRDFDWFGHGERFLLRVDPALRGDIVAGMALVALVYVGRQAWLAARGRFNPGKNAWMLAAWASWSVGLALDRHPLVSLALINLLHGIPFLVLVWLRLRAGAARGAQGRLVGWFAARAWAFLGLVALLALCEEGLWDGLVWGGTYLGERAVELSPRARTLAVALLATPQIVHYVLDAFLWKLDGSNPDFEALLDAG
ncbi:MAG: hypothetical protein D6731_18965 [Planctomycetota bacterium]|nr:MAG: hypothetical protein D6731_18965 [Planctomycetota bacterium]